ncbi:hypothetical protein MRX96_032360 [Rhipicephalus microplus]
MDPARPNSARDRRARRRHAAAPSGSPAPPPPQRPRRGTLGSSAAAPSSPASTASSSSGPAGSEAPASSRPSAPVQPRQPIMDGDVLWVYLPAPAELQCPVDSCSMKYSGAIWTSCALSVRRHVEFQHGVRVNERIYVFSGSSSPPAAPRASRRLRGLSPSDATPPVRPSSSPAARSGASSPASIGEPSAFVYLSSSGSSTSVGSASVPGSPAPSPAASLAPSEQPLRDAGGTSSPTPHIGVPTPASVSVDSPVVGSPRAPDPASPRPSSSARQALVPYDFGLSSSSNGASPAPRGSSAASPVRDAAFLLYDDDDNTISYDVAVSSPPLDAGSSPVVLPGSPVSPASSPSPPASVDEVAADPDEVQEHPETDSATLQMPPDHTRLLEDQARLLRSLLRDLPTDESWAQCEEAWTRASPWLLRRCVSHRCVLVANATSPTHRTRSTYSSCTAATVDARFS